MLSVDQLEDKLIDLAFAEDIGDGDHTTFAVFLRMLWKERLAHQGRWHIGWRRNG